MRSYYEEEIASAVQGRTGADRMALGLPCIPDKSRGDMDAVSRCKSLLKLWLLSSVGADSAPSMHDIFEMTRKELTS